MRDHEPLISIIVPIYKAELYLDKCIKSICNQSYSNIEVVLVNDGSPDHCKEMCNHYAEMDSRITVIHQENGGQAKARNIGIDVSKGELFIFVDSDDFISINMIERMYNRIQEDQSDLAVCGYTFLDEAGEEKGTYVLPDSVRTGFQALEMAYGENGFLLNSIIVNKMYKKALFEKIRFPEGRLHEDEATAYKLIDQSRLVSLLSEPLYYYVEHPNSTMTSRYSVRRLDGVEACYERYFYYRRKGGDYLRFLRKEGDVFTSVFFRSKLLFKPATTEERRRVHAIDRMARAVCFDNFWKWSWPRRLKLLSPETYITFGRIRRKLN